MITDYYWIYVPAFWLSGIIFTAPMDRQARFNRKLVLFIIFEILLSMLAVFSPGDSSLWKEAFFMAVSCGTVLVMLHSCWEISWSVACYNMIWGVSVWLLIAEATPAVLIFFSTSGQNRVASTALIIFNYILIYMLCRYTIAKWMPKGRKGRLGPRQMGLTFLLFMIIHMLSFHGEVGFIAELPYEWGYFYLTQLICIMVLYLEGELFKKSQLQQEMEMLNFLYVTQKEQYKLSRENIALINQKCHDLKHQIRALKTASKENFDRYLEEIEDSVKIYETIVKTGNDVFDTILTEKSLYCKEHQIQITCVADTGQMDFIDPIDLYSILGNSLDNAIEAVEKLKETKKRQIDVIIYCQQNFLVMNIINPLSEELTYEEGLPVTTKSDRDYHGFGLRSVRHILKKYNGFLNISEEDGCFSLKLLIPLPQKVTT